ncbi:hypothetical protein Trydic_g7099 [Trypoxylus dichotomus]
MELDTGVAVSTISQKPVLIVKNNLVKQIAHIAQSSRCNFGKALAVENSNRLAGSIAGLNRSGLRRQRKEIAEPLQGYANTITKDMQLPVDIETRLNSETSNGNPDKREEVNPEVPEEVFELKSPKAVVPFVTDSNINANVRSSKSQEKQFKHEDPLRQSSRIWEALIKPNY